MDPKDKQWCPPPIQQPVITPAKHLLAVPVITPQNRLRFKPLTAFIRRIQSFIALIPFCGVWQRKILARFDQWICLLTCNGGVIGARVIVNDGLTIIREREGRARKTYVCNIGANKFRLYEADALVGVLYPGTLWESPTTGQMQLRAMCEPGKTSIAAVTTEKRCQCGLGDYYSYSGSEPIGGPLI